MAKKSNPKNQKKRNIIIACVAAAAVIVVTIITIIIINKNALNNGSFFVSDGSKLVISLSGDRISSDEDEPVPQKTYFVYFYKDNDITDLKVYQEYANDTIAKEAFSYFKNNLSPYLKEISLDGKHVIVTRLPEEYEGITAEDVRNTIKYNEEHSDDEELDDSTDDSAEEDTENQ